MNDNEPNPSPEIPAGGNAARSLADELKEILSDQDPQMSSEQGEHQPTLMPAEFVADMYNRTLENLPDAPKLTSERVDELQRSVLNRLGEQGLGDFNDLPSAIQELGPKIIRHSTLDGLDISPLDRAILASLMVVVTRPDDLRADRVPKLRSESNEYAVLRNALTYLREASGPEASHVFDRNAKQIMASLDEAEQPKARAMNQDDEAAQAAYQERMAMLESHYSVLSSRAEGIQYSNIFLKQLREPGIPFTAQEASAAMQTAARPSSAGSTESGEVWQMDWVVLPEEPTEREKMVRADTAGAPPEVQLYRKERIDGLFDLVAQWGEGRVMESRLRGSGGDRYYVAVLPQTLPDGSPQTLPDGTPIEHAVVDNVRYGNARFVLRAELAKDEDGETLTWREVFGREIYKSQVQRMGAKKVTHQGGWQERTLDYLTRAPEDL